MPDVFDPYEERGVDNPHGPDDPSEALTPAHGTASSNVAPPELTAAQRAEERRRLEELRRKRIAPGFYEGERPAE